MTRARSARRCSPAVCPPKVWRVATFSHSKNSDNRARICLSSGSRRLPALAGVRFRYWLASREQDSAVSVRESALARGRSHRQRARAPAGTRWPRSERSRVILFFSFPAGVSSAPRCGLDVSPLVPSRPCWLSQPCSFSVAVAAAATSRLGPAQPRPRRRRPRLHLRHRRMPNSSASSMSGAHAGIAGSRR